jgi:four helix bundle protein
MRGHRELIVWQAAMDLLVECYRIAAKLPELERYGLASQLRRAAVSIPSNIAEGHGRASRGDFVRFIAIANGSLREVQTQLEAIIRLQYLAPEAVAPAADASHRVGFLLNRLRKSLLRRTYQTDPS